MDIGKRVLSLATALVLGAAIVGLTAQPTAAESKRPKDNGEACSLPGAAVIPPSENDYEFYLPGMMENVRKPNGDSAVLVCQKDGTWKEPKDAAPAPQRPAGTGRVPVQVIELAP